MIGCIGALGVIYSLNETHTLKGPCCLHDTNAFNAMSQAALCAVMRAYGSLMWICSRHYRSIPQSGWRPMIRSVRRLPSIQEYLRKRTVPATLPDFHECPASADKG
jgi:hypothetical protein